MKTRFFASFDPHADSVSAKSFRNDLAQTLALSEDQLQEIVSRVSQIALATTSGETTKLQQEIEVQTALTPAQQIQPLSIARYFLDRIAAADDSDDLTVDGLVEDVSLAGLLDDVEDVAKFKVFVNLLFEQAEFHKEAKRRRSFAAGGMPAFSSFSGTVEVRAIMESQLRLGDSVEDYSASICGYVPVLSIMIGATQGKSIHFQMDESDLGMLHDQIIRLKHDLEAVKNNLNLQVEV